MKKIADAIYEIPKEGKMNAPCRLYATEKIVEALEPGAIQQGKNMATLPGIQKYSIMLPDMHYGYGFPIGGVAAFDAEEGIVSPGGIGYDQNCGVRMITTTLTKEQVQPKLKELIDKLFTNIPSGIGSTGKLRIDKDELDEVAVKGAEWAVEQGYGRKEDLQSIEESGKIPGADPSKVSDKAKKRGKPQLGTLGSGNHFLEIQSVDEVYNEDVAGKFGVNEKGQVIIMLHCGSRGFGHQICDDYIHSLNQSIGKFDIELADRELICAPLQSDEGKDFISAMFCGVNYAFCNRQVMTHWIRETMEEIFGDFGGDLVYDVCHNVGKWEEHGGKKLFIHRKGATRAFPAGRKELSKKYINVGQPVLIPGSMGTASYVMMGTEKALEETFGSTAHGAGRIMSRSKALKTLQGDEVRLALEKKGQIVKATSAKVIAEEAPQVYKDIDEVVKATEMAGISKKVARVVPMGVAKG